MNHDELSNQLTEHIDNGLDALIAEGARLPIYGVLLASNGRVMDVKYTASADGGLSASTGDSGFAAGDIPLPAVMVLMDGSGLTATTCFSKADKSHVDICEWEFRRIPNEDDEP